MTRRGVVLTTFGVFLLLLSILGEFESGHFSAHIVYGVLIPVSAVILVLGLRNRRSEP